jgi:hypothetical protein
MLFRWRYYFPEEIKTVFPISCVLDSRCSSSETDVLLEYLMLAWDIYSKYRTILDVYHQIYHYYQHDAKTFC